MTAEMELLVLRAGMVLAILLIGAALIYGIRQSMAGTPRREILRAFARQSILAFVLTAFVLMLSYVLWAMGGLGWLGPDF